MYYAIIAKVCGTCGLLIVLALLPVSMIHTRRHRQTIDDYVAFRAKHTASDDGWPDEKTRRALMLGPHVVLSGGVIIALLSLFGVVTEFLRTDPFKTMPGFRPSPADPLLYVAVIAGSLIAIALGAWSLKLFGSPLHGLSDILRHAVYARPKVREQLFEAALHVDPALSPNREESPEKNV